MLWVLRAELTYLSKIINELTRLLAICPLFVVEFPGDNVIDRVVHAEKDGFQHAVLGDGSRQFGLRLRIEEFPELVGSGKSSARGREQRWFRTQVSVAAMNSSLLRLRGYGQERGRSAVGHDKVNHSVLSSSFYRLTNKFQQWKYPSIANTPIFPSSAPATVFSWISFVLFRQFWFQRYSSRFFSYSSSFPLRQVWQTDALFIGVNSRGRFYFVV